jgi:hypothetical protein
MQYRDRWDSKRISASANCSLPRLSLDVPLQAYRQCSIEPESKSSTLRMQGLSPRAIDVMPELTSLPALAPCRMIPLSSSGMVRGR